MADPRAGLAKEQIEDLDEEIERLTEYRDNLKAWLESDRSKPMPSTIWEKYPNG